MHGCFPVVVFLQQVCAVLEEPLDNARTIMKTRPHNGRHSEIVAAAVAIETAGCVSDTQALAAAALHPYKSVVRQKILLDVGVCNLLEKDIQHVWVWVICRPV
jgi:hypothetical protein